MSDNPFAEPEDSERTIVARAATTARPRAGAPPPLAAARQAGAASPAAGAGVEEIRLAVSPLIDAAAPLLQLIGRLRNTATSPEPNDLRERAAREVRAFETRARALGVPDEELRAAHYALCASIDDAVLNTPWGGMGGWDARSLISMFHKETYGGERFFVLLDQARQNPGRFLPLLEILYICLSLGFMGRYRLSPKGPAEIDRLREDLYTLIQRQRTAANPELSPSWRGVDAPFRSSRARVPVWVVWAVAAGIAGLIFGWSLFSLSGRSDAVFAQMLAAPPDHMPDIVRVVARPPPPVVPPAAQPDTLDRLRTFLKPEIDEGLVVVLGTPSTPIVRIRNRGMFASGSAVLNPRYNSLMDRIGGALQGEAGSVQVIGYTDNQPIRTVRFPSNYELSAARAQAARAALLHTVTDPQRITAEGRADADPIESNATPAGQDANRRIEVVLRRPS